MLRCTGIPVGVGIARTKTLAKLANHTAKRLQGQTGGVVDICDSFKRDWMLRNTDVSPSYKSRLSRLNGLKLGVSATDQRAPTCTRVVWDFLGTHIDQEDALKRTRLYRPEDSRLDADLRERLSRTEFEGGTFRLVSS